MLLNICNKYTAEDFGRNDANTVKRPVIDERLQTQIRRVGKAWLRVVHDNLPNADEETAMAAAHIAKAYIGIFTQACTIRCQDKRKKKGEPRRR